MKHYLLLTLTLLIGVVAGGTGVWVFCRQGHCGDQPQGQPSQASVSATAGQAPASSTETVAADATSTAATFGAGQFSDSVASPVPTTIIPNPTAPTRPSVLPIPTSGGLETVAPFSGLAIIGDSTADEYRADNPRGGDYEETTFNWVELLARERAIDLGAWGERSEPRRGGYEYNWARSGATTTTMLSAGQHTGVAQQLDSGQVSHVIIQIGVNDFYYDNIAFAIYEGQLTGDALQQFLDGMVGNVEQAVHTATSAGESRVMLAATQDYLAAGILPGTGEIFPDSAGQQRLINAFDYLNRGLEQVAEREGVAFFDFNAALQAELEPRFDPTGRQFIEVGGEQIDFSTKGNEPHHVFVGDDFAHPGTVVSGLIANLYMEQMNAVFGTAFEPFSDDELLRIAGIR